MITFLVVVTVLLVAAGYFGLRHLLSAWSGVLHYKRISESDVPLFDRFRVLQRPWISIYLHHYLRSDPDRGVHDHPWGWAVAVPLCAGYVEHRLRGFSEEGQRIKLIRRWPLLPYFLTGADFHRVVVPDGGRTSWSLFVHGCYCKSWGFLRQNDDVIQMTAGVSPSSQYFAFKLSSENDSSSGDWVEPRVHIQLPWWSLF